jgi:creatinine amidohydrolase
VNPPSDSLGHELLAQRLGDLPAHLEAMLRNPPSRPGLPLPRRAVVTGIGSSEAHARYLVWLLNTFTEIAAEFVPLVQFVHWVGEEFSDRTLILFSQGLSQNIRLALNQRAHFGHTVLFTAVTDSGLRAAGRTDRAELLGQLREGGVEIVPFRMEDEYDILIRVVGPACGFVAARQWVGLLAGNRLPPLHSQDVLAAYSRSDSAAPVAAFEQRHAEFRNGFVLLVSPVLLHCGHNLISKFVEGLYWPAPTVTDLLSFAHGPYQQLAAAPRPVVILHTETSPKLDLRNRALTMCASLKIEPIVVSLAGSRTLAPLEAEALFNPVILRLSQLLGVDQRNWPGKGLDGPLYAYP